ncbi:hypothetical protein HN695_00980 [Candidatus Woesearchaeota archaeon]|nr:hypothetical protein [Candidatus Woesearchaeota archaeon]MBT5272753.1 hypothetical protein [Candidatus Woesearchaeota archaeon]MBT6040364.1 hypothetical protein [Candidatus Woesearchaeota archaeon]MBT6337002.1 hypothetical protein [Candidatus Woesearchaeota archaeon]MBT7926888.1 hypothetical protein [Candidatus Woesearchaeota archaeon]
MLSFYEFINRKELAEIRKIKAYSKKINQIEQGPFTLASESLVEHTMNEAVA